MIRGVTALLFAFLLFATQEKQELCVVSGTVVDSLTGAPLAKAQVALEPAYGNGEVAQAASDDKGRFALAGVPPGRYILKGIRNGYLDTYYGARRAGSKGVELVLDAGQESTALDLKLVPYAVIAGAVRDTDGEPLAGARVALVGVTWRDGVRLVQSTGQYGSADDLGQYRIPYVKPGTYYVRAAKSREEWRALADKAAEGARHVEISVPTWHPNARDFAGARRIDVAAGERVTGADVTLLRSRLFRVRVKTASPEGLDFGVRLNERSNVRDSLGVSPHSECKDGVCEFSGVPSGAYVLEGMATPRNLSVADMFMGAKQLRASVPVDVLDSDVDGVRVTVDAGAEIVGHVEVRGEEHPKLNRDSVHFLDASGIDDRVVLTDASFSGRLSAGRYNVHVYTQKDLIVESVRSEAVDVLAEGLVIARPGKIPLSIVLSHDGATVEGVAQDGDGKPVGGATVALVPDLSHRSRADLFRDVHTDQHGRYEMAAVPPGEYQLFAWNDVEPGIWFDPEFLKNVEAKGHAVKLAAKGHESATVTVLDPGR
jgi:hypothetical protein